MSFVVKVGIYFNAISTPLKSWWCLAGGQAQADAGIFARTRGSRKDQDGGHRSVEAVPQRLWRHQRAVQEQIRRDEERLEEHRQWIL